LGAESLEVVSGAIDEGEEPLEAARRELKEETGIVAEKWTDLGLVNPFTEGVHSPANIYLARTLSFMKSALEATETLEVKKVKFSDAVQKVLDSEINHGPSCVLILKAKIFLESGV